MVKSTDVKTLYPLWLAGHEKSAPPCIMIDVRSPEEYAQGHVPGVALIPLNALAARAHEVPKQGDVYFICHSGGRSAQAVMFLQRECGHANLINVSGGTMAWSQAGFEIEKGRN
ncbi:MAG: hypothetical protein AUJ56_12880 [Zetaproteobacteria bacterium CG1_02_49_23]|nr:MAG: hypothetical protein AUJ56_12880 [Zetaproteobacteria bacterium CG1_02_49_23]